jgi:LysR family transcriptional regulator, glycine cleavage system transcriptional activator
MVELCSTDIMSIRTDPSLSTLRAFASAARHRQFQAAARELGVTPSAISHQVRHLEEWMGAALFDRGSREVKLTPHGDAFGAKLNEGFDIIAQAVASARVSATDHQILRISALPLFTSVWLMPRLTAFEAAHPHITVAVNTENRIMDFDRDLVDVAIRNVPVPTPGLVAHKLIDLRAVVLAAPDSATKLRRPEDLRGAVLIHITAGSQGWNDWLAAAGLGSLVPRGNLHVDTMPMALEAAAQGRGVMLGIAPFVHDAPQVAGLGQLFTEVKLSAGTFFVVHRKQERHDSPARAFVDWLLREMKSDARRLQRMSAKAFASP